MRNITVNRAIKILLAFLFSVNTAESLYGPILAIYITKNVAGATLETLGFAVACYAITKSFVQIPLASVLDKTVGEKKGFIAMLLGAAIGMCQTLGYLFVTSPWHFYLLSALGGIGGACLMAAYYGIFSRHVDKEAQGFEWSLFSVGGLTASSALGAAIGGVFAERYGFHETFLVASALYAVAIVILLALYPSLNTKVEPIGK